MKRSHGLMALALVQALAGASVVWRLLRTAGGEKIATSDAPRRDDRVSILVPVLNERHRLGPCLQGLIAQPEEVTEILVVDGGSDDGTRELASCFSRADRRVRVVDASPIPRHWNGKAHGLQVGLEHADPDANWVLTIDADVRVEPALVRSLLAHAARVEAAMISVATRQRLSGAREGLIHPAMLTTLVYRFGIPGQTTRRMADVQANGQCCLIRREPLERLGGFAQARGSVCEDVTVARALAKAGLGVGLYESDALAEVTMYENWREAWRNWTRSLPMRDRYSGAAGWRRLTEVAMAQALPLPLLLLLRWRPVSRSLLAVNVALALVRLGTLAGTARAYPERPWTYWLSPLLDLPVTVRIWQSAFRRAHVWRGRVLIRDDAQTRIAK